MSKLANLGAAAFSIGIPFWRRSQNRKDLFLLLVVVFLTLLLVAIAVLLTYWQRAFFNSLEDRDWDAFINLLFTWQQTETGLMPGFGPILICFVLATVYVQFYRQALQIRWREWMTREFIERWLNKNHYYKSNLGIGPTENPDQRIAEDIDLFVGGTLELGLGFLSSLVSLVSFMILLWSLSDTVTFFGASVPGSLVWLALLYAGLGTIGTHFLGRRLIPLSFDQQHVEADFRYSLIQVRDNAESVAFHKGEDNEKGRLDQSFESVVLNWRDIMNVTKRMTFFTSSYNQAALVFPLAIAAPAYFAGRMPLGGIFQTAGAFVQVQVALSWIVDNYARLAEWMAAIRRLHGFLKANEAAQSHSSQIMASAGSSFEARELTVKLPDGRLLFEDANIDIADGERIVVTGSSGIGKSVLLRVMAGIWPFGTGEVSIPEGRFLFLPQKPYFPKGTLRNALSYPERSDAFADNAIARALDLVGMGHLSPFLDEERSWRDSLSGGEQQRLAIARAFLIRPDWLVLDEATANLDEAWERRVYEMLAEELPETTIVSVAHRKEAIRHHDKSYTIDDGRLMQAR